jgi:hypothetical protein
MISVKEDYSRLSLGARTGERDWQRNIILRFSQRLRTGSGGECRVFEATREV